MFKKKPAPTGIANRPSGKGRGSLPSAIAKNPAGKGRPVGLINRTAGKRG